VSKFRERDLLNKKRGQKICKRNFQKRKRESFQVKVRFSIFSSAEPKGPGTTTRSQCLSANARGGRGGRRAAGAVIPGHRPCRRRGGMPTSRVSAEHPPRLPERALGELMPRQQSHVSLAASQQGRISAIPSAEFRARPAAAGLGGDSRRITAMPAGVSAYTAARCECATVRPLATARRPRGSRCCGPSLPAPYVSLCAAATALPRAVQQRTAMRWGRRVGSSPVPARVRANDCFC
jgi:hypothetical protein